jgi:hypothetical protein
MKKFSVSVGDKVAYSVQFLKSIGCYTGDMPQARGTVTKVQTFGGSLELATIEWNMPDMPEKVNVQNLAKVGVNTRFSAC